ncbi:MAG: hypothetical protein LBU65_04820 [Planctomycetaceae bacterium]|nr:hypothetical protein [Planctomycetaceae bacterium]
MQLILLRSFVFPDVRLISCSVPVMRRVLIPAVKNRFILTLIIRASYRESVLDPDDKR